jgi:hypothetical protein
VDWTHLAQGPLAGPCGHGNEHSGSIKGGEFFDLLSDSFFRRTLPHVVS